MARNASNFAPISMAVILHVVLFASMLVAFDWARPAPFTPMMIRATLVPEIPDAAPPVVEKKPDPVPPQPDNSEELRRQAEEEKRIHDTLIEKQRLEKIRRQKEAEREKQNEARKERERQEAERKRQEDIQRQRDENERIRKELEAEARQAEIDAEENRFAAVNSGELAVYMALIGQKIERNWAAPASAGAELKCTVRVRQLPGGDVIGVTILTCNGDDAVRRSVEAAIYRSSPLPEPSDPSLFDRNILLNLSIRQ